LSGEHAQKLAGLANDFSLRSRAVHPFSLAGEAGRSVDSDVIVYRSGDLLVLELDPRREAAPDNPLPILHTMLRGVHQADSMPRCCQAIVDEVRRVIGFDRVMLYRFLNDGSGEVIAESVETGAESFLGLRYPESDIPKQARELYRLNWLRAIPDARYSPAPILSISDAGSARSLDLSNSTIRSVSPVHRQYLANMGVVASLSMSIVMQGRLWGLIACHHRAPRYVPYTLREACELFAEMVSSQLEGRAAAESFKTEQRSRQVHEELVNRLSRESELAAGLIRFRPNLLDLVPAGGVGLWMDGQFSNIGATPQPSEIKALVEWLNATVKDGVFHTDHLPLIYPPAERFVVSPAGCWPCRCREIPATTCCGFALNLFKR
jgi:chemotaxis family two-component system sensor kinase Cph1